MTYELSKRATADLDGIIHYGRETLGVVQTGQYVSELQSYLELLVSSPYLGRQASNVASDLRRTELASHVVFYRLKNKRVIVSRILHKSMLPGRHAF